MSDSILQVNQIKDKGGNATGITVADNTANVTIGNLTATSLAGGTIASAVNINTQDYFIARLSGNQTVSHDTLTILQFAETHDPQSWFASYKFTPQKAGKYLIYVSAHSYNNTGVTKSQIHYVTISKNNNASSNAGEQVKAALDTRANYFYEFGGTTAAVIDFNGSSDYVYALFYPNMGVNTSTAAIVKATHSEFGGFRIGQ